MLIFKCCENHEWEHKRGLRCAVEPSWGHRWNEDARADGDVSVGSSPWGRIQISPLTCLMLQTGLFHPNWAFFIIPSHLQTPQFSVVLTSLKMGVMCWDVEKRGQKPLRLPRECHRQVSLIWWLVGLANWESVRGKVSCPARGSHLSLYQVWMCFSVVAGVFRGERWRCGKWYRISRWGFRTCLERLMLQEQPRVSGHGLWEALSWLLSAHLHILSCACQLVILGCNCTLF